MVLFLLFCRRGASASLGPLGFVYVTLCEKLVLGLRAAGVVLALKLAMLPQVKGSSRVWGSSIFYLTYIGKAVFCVLLSFHPKLVYLENRATT